MTSFPILYTRTGTGSIQYWKVDVVEEDDGVYIIKDYGKLGGKAIINKKLISVAKSKDTPLEQAQFEAQGDWNDKTNKKGYLLTNIWETQTAPPAQPMGAVPIKIVIKPIGAAKPMGTGPIKIVVKSPENGPLKIVLKPNLLPLSMGAAPPPF
jgi:hypothetical protein